MKYLALGLALLSLTSCGAYVRYELEAAFALEEPAARDCSN